MAEYFDVLDDKGNKTGKTKLRSEVHRDGDWHRSVHVWLLNSEGELLIQRRVPTKDSHPNKWTMSAGGHVSAGQSITEAALREMREEIGLEVREEDIEFLFSVCYQNVSQNGTFIDNEYDDVMVVEEETK
jgi:isopentenyldiphosphate isomerase